MQRHEHNRVKYRYFINGLFDEIPDDKLIYAVIYLYNGKRRLVLMIKNDGEIEIDDDSDYGREIIQVH